TSIPPRDDSASADAQVPLYNLAVRAVAQGRGVPFVDFHRELVPLAGHGLAGDGVHLAAHASGSCVLTPAGLQYGANVRNLLTIEELDRARRALGGETLNIDAPRLRGDGSPGAPFEIDALPFAVLADTRASSHRDLDAYSCSTADESGPELRYRLVLDAPASVTALAVSGTGADVDIHILGAGGTAADCLARDNRIVTLNLAAGTYYVVADTFVSGGVEQTGEVLVLVHAS
ncbi:MAG: SGNH/GDSL hydrolase family protein, partial [Sandaracinaceae bacterium]|nr:SGNH/GDSL hydrolase family protein [Sandaracinaceae bacterium]